MKKKSGETILRGRFYCCGTLWKKKTTDLIDIYVHAIVLSCNEKTNMKGVIDSCERKVVLISEAMEEETQEF